MVDQGRRCGSCGEPVASDAEWCTSCGAAVASSVTKTAPGEPTPEAFGEAVAGPVAGPVAGSQPKKTQLFAAGTLIDNKYEIERVLGQGGMGVVYLAEDVHTKVPIVLKAVRPELAHRKDIRDRTLTEGRTLARIDHPNVVHLNAVVEDATGLWLVMQYIEGESLDETVKRYKSKGERLAFTVVIDIFRQILLGVGAAHRDGVVHRDLKPANVLVRRKDGVVKVTDFGIAKPAEDLRGAAGKTKGVIGSLWYMAPEQVQGRRDLDKRADIYALGILLFELLTGRVPFNAESSYDIMKMHVESPLPKVVAERPDAPAWIDEVLARACAKAREDRFSTCEEFLSAVERHTGSAQPRLTSVAPPPETRIGDGGPHVPVQATISGTATTGTVLPVDGSRTKVVVGAVAVALVGVVGFFVWRGSQADTGPRRTGDAASSTAAVDTSTAAPTVTAPTSASTSPPDVDPLDALEGRWKSEAGTQFDAVRVGDAVEFRVVDPAQLAPYDFRAEEARFVVSLGAGGKLAVEDKVRPMPPVGMTFDPRSRISCQEVWTEVDGKPLSATFDGARLSVDFAKIAPRASNFSLEGKSVVGCKGLASVSASRGRTVLSR